MIAREKPSPTDPKGQPDPGAAGSRGRIDPSGESSPSPFEPLLRHLAELQMLAGHYLRARASQITARVRMLVLWAIVAMIGLVIATAILVTAVVLVLHGIAVGLMSLGLLPWAADLITGGACILIVALALFAVSMSQRSAARRKKRDDYEHFRARYRAKFGHSVEDAGRDS